MPTERVTISAAACGTGRRSSRESATSYAPLPASEKVLLRARLSVPAAERLVRLGFLVAGGPSPEDEEKEPFRLPNEID